MNRTIIHLSFCIIAVSVETIRFSLINRFAVMAENPNKDNRRWLPVRKGNYFSIVDLKRRFRILVANFAFLRCPFRIYETLTLWDLGSFGWAASRPTTPPVWYQNSLAHTESLLQKFGINSARIAKYSAQIINLRFKSPDPMKISFFEPELSRSHCLLSFLGICRPNGEMVKN